VIAQPQLLTTCCALTKSSMIFRFEREDVLIFLTDWIFIVRKSSSGGAEFFPCRLGLTGAPEPLGREEIGEFADTAANPRDLSLRR
jgi:hypothetical protein